MEKGGGSRSVSPLISQRGRQLCKYLRGERNREPGTSHGAAALTDNDSAS